MPPRFLFIGGLARSGTTMLRDMLEQHPDITGLQHEEPHKREGQWHQQAYPRPSDCGGPGDYAPTYWEPQPSPWARDHLLEAWTPLIHEERKWVAEKSPPNISLAPFLHGCFPDSRFIFILRHPIAACLALRKWSESGLPKLIENWCVLHEKWRASIEAHPEIPHRTVRYEQLILDHEAVCHGLHNWLGLERTATEYEVDQGSQERYYGEYISRYDVYSAQATFRTMLYNYERRVNAFGYSLTPEAVMERGGMHEGRGKFETVTHKA